MDTMKPALVLPYTVGEEIANSILHGIGVLGAITGMVLLTLKTIGGNAVYLISVVLFTSSMIGMFLASTLYHAIRHKGAKSILRIIDHLMIYILIAGTYTPFCLIALKGVWGLSIFAVEWFLAAAGITLYVMNNKTLKKIEKTVYIMMGWIIIVGFVPLVRAVPVVSLILLFTGGVAYTMGTIWYRRKNVSGSHVVWHVFVLLGAVCHWFSIWFLKI